MEQSAPGRQQSILILDSDYDLSCILASFLSVQKMKVAQSKKAREALFKLRNQNFDLVLLDPAVIDEKYFFNGLQEFASSKNKPSLVIMTSDLSYELPKTLIFPLKTVLPKPFDLDSFWRSVV